MTRSVKIRARRLQDASKTPQDAPGRPNLVPKTAQEPPKRRPRPSRAAQERPKTHPGSGRQGPRSQMTTKSGPRAAQKLPDPLQLSILDNFGNDLPRIWDPV